ncbi:MAG: hypothetical protein LBI57_00160 [Helicobacteraceae bacterium]|jgi:hypothetical protein|nr:hypothetical protein [Helicobacteraceae bacterium]
MKKALLLGALLAAVLGFNGCESPEAKQERLIFDEIKSRKDKSDKKIEKSA